MARSKLQACPSNVTELNENLYELCAPNGVPEVEIIFFHGLQLGDYKEAFWRTWLSRDETVLWPKDWLGRSFPRARILSISYDSCATGSGDDDMYNIGENLLNNVILNGQSNVGQNCPVVLVGHSLGGLAIKHLVLFSHQRRFAMDSRKFPEDYNKVDKFLNNFRGVFYYSTPHAGTRLADSVVEIPCINARDTLHVLTTLNRGTGRINENFREWRGIHGQSAFSVAEAFPTKILKYQYNAKVVEEASARHDTDGFITVSADHVNVCKPERLKNSSFLSLCDFIRRVALPGRPITYQAVDAQENESLR